MSIRRPYPYARFLTVSVVTVLLALLSPTWTSASGLNDDIFLENQGQIRSSRGENADSVLAYAHFGSSRIHVTANALYVSRTDSTTAVRFGILFPSGFTALLPQRSSPTAPIRLYNSGSYEDIRTFPCVRIVNPVTKTAFSLRIESCTLVMDHVDGPMVNSSGFRLQGLSRTINGSMDTIVRWMDPDGRSVFTESVSVGGRRPTGQSSIPTPFSWEFLPLDVFRGTEESSILSQDPEQRVTVLLKASTFLGGSGADSVLCTIPVPGGIIACGSTNSSTFPCTPGVSQTTLKGSKDAWIARYDASARPLWSTYFGGNGDDVAGACTVNGSDVIICGTTSSTDLGTSGTVKNTFQGGASDAFMAIFSLSAGTRSACTYVGGPEADEGRAVCALPSGDVAMCGTTYSPDMAFKGHQAQLTGGSDAFAVVTDPALTTIRWGTYYGGRADEEGRGVSALDDGSIIIAGNTSSPNSGLRIAENVGQGSTPPGGLQTSGFVARLSATGSRVWGRYLGGDAFDTVTCVRTLGDGIYLGGFTNSQPGGMNNFISGGSAQPGSGSGINDGFISKLQPDGTIIWGTYIGGAKDDKVFGLTVTPMGDVIACGTTNSDNFPVVESDQTRLAGGYDAFVAYLLKNGQKYGRALLLGGANDDAAAGSSFLADRSVLVAGTTSSPSFPTSQAAQPAFAGATDAFITLLEPLYTVSVPDPSASDVGTVTYPMPACASVTISSSSIMRGPSTLRCFTALGTEVQSATVTDNADRFTLDMAGLPPGMYVVVWSNEVRSASCTVLMSCP